MSGREMSGDFGPPPSPCFGPQGAGGFWTRSGMEKTLEIKNRKASWAPEGRAGTCHHLSPMPRCVPMRRLALTSCTILLAAALCANLPAQNAADKTDRALLETLAKKIDEQNAKIDALSQQILKLEQQVSHPRPGVMIGESPTPAPSANAAATEASKAPQTGNSHVVAKGETLTSIAKMHKVTVEELQKFNHIENDRKLQIGQTIMIPPSANSPASPSPSAPNG